MAVDISVSKVKKSRILIVGAMDTELNPLLKVLSFTKRKKLLNTFPLYHAVYKSLELFILQTFVGDVNASVAGIEAIREVNPDFVIKIGAVGGSYKESKTGDVIVPLGFFHRTSWITRDKLNNKPCSNASEWLSVFGELPFQVNSCNLGNLPYYFPASIEIQKVSINLLHKLNLKYVSAFVGGGNMWMFSQELLDNVAATMIPRNSKNKRFVSDMESYSLAHACYLTHKPFVGCYVVASNDYIDEKYNPLLVSEQISRLVPYVLNLTSNLSLSI